MSPTDLAVQDAKVAQRRSRVVNDFSLQVATVNGSGSQTANLVFSYITFPGCHQGLHLLSGLGGHLSFAVL